MGREAIETLLAQVDRDRPWQGLRSSNSSTSSPATFHSYPAIDINHTGGATRSGMFCSQQHLLVGTPGCTANQSSSRRMAALVTPALGLCTPARTGERRNGSSDRRRGGKSGVRRPWNKNRRGAGRGGGRGVGQGREAKGWRRESRRREGKRHPAWLFLVHGTMNYKVSRT
jgi:hypothetical protein